MPGNSSPTVQRRQLGRQLRLLRESRNLTTDRVAELLDDFSQTKVSRIERGTVRPRVLDVEALLRLYAVESEVAEALLGLARASKERSWWHAYADTLPERFQTFVGLEGDADEILTFEPMLVPGLVQTPDYARAVFSSGDARPSEVDRRLAVRMERQKLLAADEPTVLRALLDESALHRLVGGTGVMRAQLDRLLHVTTKDNITLQVVPYRAGAHPGEGAFTLLEFPNSDLPTVVYLDNLTGGMYTDKPAEVDRFVARFNRIRDIALTPADSTAMIREIADRLDGRKP